MLVSGGFALGIVHARTIPPVPQPCQPPDVEVLRRAGYTDAAVHAALDRVEEGRPELRRAAQLLALDPDDPLDRLIKLFRFGEPAPYVPGLEPLVRREGELAVPEVLIAELDGEYVCFDIDPARADLTPPVSGSTLLCAAFTPVVPVERALDLGTGQGAHALRMARFAGQVVATDVSERVAAASRASTRRSTRHANIETRAGSFLDPVRGERFGLVVCNPPYVISPDQRFVYRDSELAGDGVSRTLLGELPALLEDGGHAVLQGNWIHGAQEPWWRPLEQLLDGSRCDAWLCRITTWNPLQYAATWADDEAALARWHAAYVEAGIEAITSAMVVLRRRPAGRNWRVAVTLRARPDGLAERLPDLAAVHERLHGSAPLRRAPGLEVERRSGERSRAILHLASTFEGSRPVSPAVAELVLGLDGTRAVTPEVATLLKLGFIELPEDRVDPRAVRSQLNSAARARPSARSRLRSAASPSRSSARRRTRRAARAAPRRRTSPAARRCRRRRPACRTPSPRAPAARSPRSATAARTPRAPA